MGEREADSTTTAPTLEAGFDLVVVGFSGEKRALKLLARSLRLFAEPGLFGAVHIIINEKDPRPLTRFYKRHIEAELGPWADATQLSDAQALVGHPLDKTGWRSQQSLKLLAARQTTSRAYLVLDSKNHFIRPVGPADFFAEDGRLKTHMYGLNKDFEHYFNNGCHYFGAPVPPADSHVMPTATPFLFDTNQVRAMLDEIERLESKPFHDHFMASRAFTEFYLYYAWLLSEAGRFDRLYEIRPKPNVTLFGSVADDPDQVADRIAILEQPEVYCFGVHRDILKTGRPDILHAIAAVWQRFGLVTDAAEARWFLRYDKPARRRWYWPF